MKPSCATACVGSKLLALPRHALSLVCPAARENVPDKYGLRGAVVVEDHSKVLTALRPQNKTLRRVPNQALAGHSR